MKKKTWLSILFASALAGCAGGAKKNSPAGVQDAAGISADGEAPSPAKGSPMAESRPTGGVDRKYQALSQALRGGAESAVVSEASKLLAANGGDPVALNALAMFQFKQGRVGAAKILLEKAFEQNQNNASLLNNFALVQLAEGDLSAALQTLKKAYRVDDNNPDVLGNLGSLYVRGGDYAKALPLLEQAYRANRNNVAIGTNYAIALRANKSYDKAEDVYESLVKANSRDVALHLNYAILLIDYLNKGKEGLPVAIKVKFLETERKDVLDRANALEKKARSELK